MKLIYLGQALDAAKQHELFSTNEFGFFVDIKYTEESWYPEKNELVWNCTEVHWMFDEHEYLVEHKSVAFESDIKRSGFVRKINTIESITISLAKHIYPHYRTRS